MLKFIHKNKQNLVLLFIMVLFCLLLNNNIIFCEGNLTLWGKFSLKMNNYVDNLTIEKAMEDSYKLFYSAGYYGVWTIGGTMFLGCTLQGFEYVWNSRLLTSKALYNFTPFGHVDDFGGKATSWLGFRNTSGPLKQIIDTVPYEEFWVLNKTKYYLLPAFIQKPAASPLANTQKIVTLDTTKYIPFLEETTKNRISQALFSINQKVEYYKQHARDMNNLLDELVSKQTELLAQKSVIPQKVFYNTEFLSPYMTKDFMFNNFRITENVRDNNLFTSWTRGEYLNTQDFINSITHITPATLYCFHKSVVSPDSFVREPTDTIQTAPEKYSLRCIATIGTEEYTHVIEGFFDLPLSELLETNSAKTFISFFMLNEEKDVKIYWDKDTNNCSIPEFYHLEDGVTSLTELRSDLLNVNLEVSNQIDSIQTTSVAVTALLATVTGVLHEAPEILSHIETINLLSTAITNTEIGSAIANVFITQGQEIPEFLQQYVITPNPQDVSSVETPTATEAYSLNYKYIGVAILAAGVFGLGYWYFKNTGDSTVLQTASNFEAELLKDIK